MNAPRRAPLMPMEEALALLLAREDVPVLVHGTATEDRRVTSATVFAALRHEPADRVEAIAPGQCRFIPTEVLHPGLKRLLDVRRVVGLRNPAHSLVKHFNPLGRGGFASLVVGCYTHPEYALSMATTHAEAGGHALLLRGTEGEPVADPRRLPQLNGYLHGTLAAQRPAQGGSLASLPDLPQETTAEAAARYSLAVLRGELPVPQPLTEQVDLLRSMADELH